MPTLYFEEYCPNTTVRNEHIHPEVFFNPNYRHLYKKPLSFYLGPVEFSLDTELQERRREKIKFVNGKTAFFRYISRDNLYQEKVGYYVFCPICKEEHPADVCLTYRKESAAEEQLRNEHSLDNVVDIKTPPLFAEGMYCRNCNHFIESSYLMEFNHHTKKTPKYSLYENVYDNGDIVSLKITEGFAELTKNDKLKLTTIKTGFAFNAKTGQSYHTYTGFDNRRKDSGIRNISLLCCPNKEISKNTYFKIFGLLFKKKEELFGHPPLNFFNFHKSELHPNLKFDEGQPLMSGLIAYNRLPNIHEQFFYTILRREKHMKKVKHTSSDVLGDICKLYNYRPSRRVRKYLLAEPAKIKLASNLAKEIPSTDFLLSILDKIPAYADELPTVFLQELISRFGEKVAYRKLSYEKDFYYLFRDTDSMFRQLKDQVEQEIDLRGNLKEIHDRLVLLKRSIANPGYRFNYSEEQKSSMNAAYNGLNFKLAENSDELNSVGFFMSICVGSYSRNVFDKNVHIVYVEKEGRPVMCIELTRDFKKIVQCKTQYNNIPSGEFLLSVLQWAKDRKIKIETYDITETLESLEDKSQNIQNDIPQERENVYA